MIVIVKRIFKATDYTIGHVYLDYEDGGGQQYLCDSLEDACRIVSGDCTQKIYARTAIPEGLYDIEVIWWEKHKQKYPHIKDVKCFTGIMVHGGVDEGDTEGCILLGENKVKGHLQNCSVYVRKLTDILKGYNRAKIRIQ